MGVGGAQWIEGTEEERETKGPFKGRNGGDAKRSGSLSPNGGGRASAGGTPGFRPLSRRWHGPSLRGSTRPRPSHAFSQVCSPSSNRPGRGEGVVARVRRARACEGQPLKPCGPERGPQQPSAAHCSLAGPGSTQPNSAPPLSGHSHLPHEGSYEAPSSHSGGSGQACTRQPAQGLSELELVRLQSVVPPWQSTQLVTC